MQNKPFSLLLLAIFFFTFFQNLNAQNQKIQLIIDPIVPGLNQSSGISIQNKTEYSGQINIQLIIRSEKGKILLKSKLDIPVNSREGTRIVNSDFQIQFIDPAFAELYESNKLIPFNHSICYKANYLGDINSTAEECQSYLASDFINIIPIYPRDKGELYEKQPTFTWVSGAQQDPAIGYKVTISQKNKNQNPNEAIRRNTPLVISQELKTGQYVFPNDANPFVKGEDYVWQLDILYNGEKVSKSDVYTFNYTEGGSINEIPRNPSYVDLNNLNQGITVYAVGELKLKYQSEINGNFQIKLFDPKKDKWIQPEIKNLKFNRGENKFKYDLKEQVYLRHLQEYVISLSIGSERTYKVKLMYVNPDYLN